jgi:hypothetical protein
VPLVHVSRSRIRGTRASGVDHGRNFELPGHKGTPEVPSGGALIVLGNFPTTWRPASQRWPRVDRLQLPADATPGKRTEWQVRFHSRALVLSVVFGSDPPEAAMRAAGLVLGSVRSAQPR